MGAQPIVPYEDEDSWWDSVEKGEDAVLGKAARHEWAMLENTDVYLHMWGPGDRMHLNALDQARRERVFEFNPRWYKTAQRAGVRGARLELGRPYPTLARAYGVDQSEWLNQIVSAMMVTPDEMKKTAAPVVKALHRGKRLRIRDGNGTDLTLGLLGRPVQSEIGRSTLAERKKPFGSLIMLPGGSVRVALDETVADGTLIANRTTYYDDGKATGGVFRFRRGRLVESEVAEGQEHFDVPYKTGGKGRDRPGVLSVGLNPCLRNTPQVEERELGAVLVSVGGNSYQGGRNNSTFYGTVLIEGASMEIDGKPVSLSR